MKYYPLAKPCVNQEEEKAVLRVLRSGKLSSGPMAEEFEKKFAKKIGTRFACSVNSGTAGLHLTMLAAGIGLGDEVITTPFSFVSSANCILYVGAKPVFVDIDPITCNIDPDKIESKITKKTKAILVVHIFGQPADMDPIMKIAKKYRLKVIEDACESIGAKYKGKQVGTFGESAVFAFYPNKQMTTGEGGIIVTNNRRIYTFCKSLANQGRKDNKQWLNHQYLGYNYRLDEMSAALGLVQLRKLSYFINQRRKIAGWFSQYLAKFSEYIESPKVLKGNTHTWFVYVIKLKKIKIKRDELIKKLSKEGIAAKAYFPSIHLFKLYKKRFGYKNGDLPVSESVSQRSLALPFYVGLKKNDCRNIIYKLSKIVQKKN